MFPALPALLLLLVPLARLAMAPPPLAILPAVLALLLPRLLPLASVPFPPVLSSAVWYVPPQLPGSPLAVLMALALARRLMALRLRLPRLLLALVLALPLLVHPAPLLARLVQLPVLAVPLLVPLLPARLAPLPLALH